MKAFYRFLDVYLEHPWYDIQLGDSIRYPTPLIFRDLDFSTRPGLTPKRLDLDEAESKVELSALDEAQYNYQERFLDTSLRKRRKKNNEIGVKIHQIFLFGSSNYKI